jgi:hypothetical protein
MAMRADSGVRGCVLGRVFGVAALCMLLCGGCHASADTREVTLPRPLANTTAPPVSPSAAPSGYTVGDAQSPLTLAPLPKPTGLRVDGTLALAVATAVAQADDHLFGSGTLLSLTYGAVTTPNLGLAGRPEWVALYRVPFADLLPDSCPRLRPTPLPTPTTATAAVLVDPATATPRIWQTDRRQHCAP